MTQRPLFRELRLLTSKYFEIFCADTIPLVMIDPDHAVVGLWPGGVRHWRWAAPGSPTNCSTCSGTRADTARSPRRYAATWPCATPTLGPGPGANGRSGPGRLSRRRAPAHMRLMFVYWAFEDQGSGPGHPGLHSRRPGSSATRWRCTAASARTTRRSRSTTPWTWPRPTRCCSSSSGPPGCTPATTSTWVRLGRARGRAGAG